MKVLTQICQPCLPEAGLINKAITVSSEGPGLEKTSGCTETTMNLEQTHGSNSFMVIGHHNNPLFQSSLSLPG